MNRPFRVFVSTGEPSGSLYGAQLTLALRRLNPRVRVEGFGDRKMAAAGARVDGVLHDRPVMGWTGTLRAAGRLLGLLGRQVARWRRRPPDAVVLIDYPGFNLRLGERAHAAGIPVFYFVCPQVWAWGSGRLLLMRRILRRAFVVLPFEEALYQSCGVRASFVGHPLLEVLPRRPPPAGPLLAAAGLDPRLPCVALQPGSREEEVRRHLPILVAGATLVAKRRPDLQWPVIATASTLPVLRRLLRAAAPSGRTRGLVPLGDPGFAVRAAAAVSWTASGTATLETGLLGVPQVVFYRGHWLNWQIARRLVNVPAVSLVNLLLRRREVPELLQDEFTPEALASLTRRALGRDGRPAARELRGILGAGRATRAVAGAVLREGAAS